MKMTIHTMATERHTARVGVHFDVELHGDFAKVKAEALIPYVKQMIGSATVEPQEGHGMSVTDVDFDSIVTYHERL